MTPDPLPHPPEAESGLRVVVCTAPTSGGSAASDGAPPAHGGQASSAHPLTRRQKAAVIVRLLLDDGQVSALAHLDDAMQADLTAAMVGMRYIDRETLGTVVREFLEELEGIGITFPGGLDRALELLESHISVRASDQLRRAQAALGGADPWARLAALTPDEIAPLIDGESPLIAATVLSKLSTAKAALLLERMEGTRAREIALAIPAISATGPDTVKLIGETLTARLDDRPRRAFTDDPAARIGSILNLAPAATRDSILEGLDSADQTLAEQVRRAIFTFSDIPDRVEPTDVPGAIRSLDAAVLVTALLAAADTAPDAAEFLLENMSKRMAGQIREEMQDRAPVKRREADAALVAVVEEIRARADAGDISLIAPEEADG